jgi:hypothetical protein
MPVPKAAAALASDAKKAGFEVEVKETSIPTGSLVEVFITGEYSDGMAVWQPVNTAGNSRLGFPTSYKPGMRFDYASAKVGSHYYSPRSVSQLRNYLGIS